MGKRPVLIWDIIAALTDEKPCEEQVALCNKHWPDGMPLTKKNWTKLIRLGIDYGWLVKILSQPALAEYEKVKQSALAEYRKVAQSALAEYEKVKQSALAEYRKVEQPAWAEYRKVEQPAWAEYRKVEQPAWAECEKVGQSAWAECEKVGQSALLSAVIQTVQALKGESDE